MPEPWLRGPVEGIVSHLQPAAHALIMAQEEVVRACRELTEGQLWERPAGIASVGFHLAHLSGSTDRLLTYARGDQLSEEQLETLQREREIDQHRPPKQELLDRWARVSEEALEALSRTPTEALLEPRAVGRAALPSTVLGLLFHVAEHASRHTGQLVTTAKLVADG